MDISEIKVKSKEIAMENRNTDDRGQMAEKKQKAF
jgi:hypothetical protein